MGIVVITSQTLGAEGRGSISFILLFINLAQVCAEFVSGSSLINLAPQEKLINLLIPSYLVNVAVALLLPVFLFLYSDLSVSFWVISLTCLFLGLLNTNLNLILGRAEITARNVLQLGYTFLILSGIYVIYHLSGKQDIQWYFEVLCYVYGLAWVFSLSYLFKIKQKEDFGSFKWNPIILKWGWWSQLSQVVNLLNYRMMYFFIERDFGLKDLGVFSNAMTVGDMLKISGHSLGQVQHNRIINSAKPAEKGNEILGKYLALNSVFYAMQTLVLIWLPVYFWTWLLGEDFVDLKNQIIMLLPGFVAMGVGTSFSFHFHALGKFKIVLAVNAIGLAIFVLAYGMFKPSFGFEAIHYSFSISFAAQLLLFVVVFKILRKTAS